MSPDQQKPDRVAVIVLNIERCPDQSPGILEYDIPNEGPGPLGVGMKVAVYIMRLGPAGYKFMYKALSDVTWIGIEMDDTTAPTAKEREDYRFLKQWTIPEGPTLPLFLYEDNHNLWAFLLLPAYGLRALNLVRQKKVKHLLDMSLSFIEDVHPTEDNVLLPPAIPFCEWAYVIDFNEQTLSVKRMDPYLSNQRCVTICFDELARHGCAAMMERAHDKLCPEVTKPYKYYIIQGSKFGGKGTSQCVYLDGRRKRREWMITLIWFLWRFWWRRRSAEEVRMLMGRAVVREVSDMIMELKDGENTVIIEDEESNEEDEESNEEDEESNEEDEESNEEAEESDEED